MGICFFCNVEDGLPFTVLFVVVEGKFEHPLNIVSCMLQVYVQLGGWIGSEWWCWWLWDYEKYQFLILGFF